MEKDCSCGSINLATSRGCVVTLSVPRACHMADGGGTVRVVPDLGVPSHDISRHKRKRPNHLVHRWGTSTPTKRPKDEMSSSDGSGSSQIGTPLSSEVVRKGLDVSPISDSEAEEDDDGEPDNIWSPTTVIRIPLPVPKIPERELRTVVKNDIDDDNGLARNGDKDMEDELWPYGPSLCKKASTPSRELSSPMTLHETGSTHDETSSSGHKDDDDDDEEDSDDFKTMPHDSERLKAFNMFVRLFVDENLDRQVPISKQPKEKIQAIIDSCTRQFPEFGDRARKRIRTYLKSCRRNKKTRDSTGWPESNRPTPAHLTSVQAEQILAQACENESHNAKRMRLGLEPVSQPMPLIPGMCEPTRTLVDHFSPANLTEVKVNNNNNKSESPNCQVKPSIHLDNLTKTVNSTVSTMSASPANGGFRGNSSPGFHSTHGFTSSPIFPNYHQSNVHNGPTDLSMKSVKPILSHKLNPTEIAAVRQLITGYRESAAFLLRSADELEQLLIQQQ